MIQPLQVAIGALATKSVGSLYRIHDVKDAPAPVQEAAKRREFVIMFSATILSLLVSWVFEIKSFLGYLAKHPIGKYQILLQNAMMVGALLAGEAFGRYIMPPLDWHGVRATTVHDAEQGKEPIAMAGVPNARFNIPVGYTPNARNANFAAGQNKTGDAPQVRFGNWFTNMIKLQPLDTVALHGSVKLGTAPYKLDANNRKESKLNLFA